MFEQARLTSLLNGGWGHGLEGVLRNEGLRSARPCRERSTTDDRGLRGPELGKLVHGGLDDGREILLESLGGGVEPLDEVRAVHEWSQGIGVGAGLGDRLRERMVDLERIEFDPVGGAA